METIFLCFQIRALDASRFPDTPAGQLGEAHIKQIEAAIRYCLGL